MSKKETINSEFEQLIHEVAKTTSVKEDDVRKVLSEITVRYMRKLATELSDSTGVPVKEVGKVLEGLGVSEALHMAPLGVMHQIGLQPLKGAIRDALLQVVM